MLLRLKKWDVHNLYQDTVVVIVVVLNCKPLDFKFSANCTISVISDYMDLITLTVSIKHEINDTQIFYVIQFCDMSLHHCK